MRHAARALLFTYVQYGGLNEIIFVDDPLDPISVPSIFLAGGPHRRCDQLKPADCVQRLDSGADTCSRHGGGDEEQQRGRVIPCG